MRKGRALRFVLRLAPRHFRDRHGAELLETHGLRLERARLRGRTGGAMLAAREILGALDLVVRLWADVGVGRGVVARTPSRRAGSMDALGQDVRFAWRTLRRNPAYALTAMVVLALGIGANTAVFTVVKGALLAPLGYPDADRLVRIWSSHPERGLEFFSVSVADYLDWRRARGAFTVLGAFENERGVPLTSTVGQPEEVLAARVTPELFSVLGTPTLLGRSLGPEDVRLGESPVVVLSHEFWRSHLGEDAAAIGRALHVDGVSYIVVGVMPASFTIPGDDAVIWTPLDVHRAEPAGDRGADRKSVV